MTRALAWKPLFRISNSSGRNNPLTVVKVSDTTIKDWAKKLLHKRKPIPGRTEPSDFQWHWPEYVENSFYIFNQFCSLVLLFPTLLYNFFHFCLLWLWPHYLLEFYTEEFSLPTRSVSLDIAINSKPCKNVTTAAHGSLLNSHAWPEADWWFFWHP